MASLIGFRTSFGVFFKILAAEFGWSRAETSGAFSMGMLGFAFSAPVVGFLLDKWSIRWTMAAGVFLFGTGMLTGYFVGALWHLYLMNFLLSLGFGAATYLPQTQVLSNWFIRRRGLALGLTSSAQGIAFSTSIITSSLIAWLGWRETYLTFGVATLLLTLPVVAIFLRDRPSQLNTIADAPFLSPDERTAHQSAMSTPASVGEGALPFDLIFSLPFLFLSVLFATIAYIFTALVVHLVPLVTDNGFTPSGGAGLFALFGISVFLGNILSSISDRIGRVLTYLFGALLGTVSCLFLAVLSSEAVTEQLFIGGITVGLALGMVRPTIVAMLADHFSGSSFGRVNGIMMTLFALVGASGPLVTGYLFDRFARYQESVLLMAGIFLMSCLFAVAQNRMKKPIPEIP
jgi:MFS family permease